MAEDSLYRISLKCIIKNDNGEVLTVKESGRSFWDLPGGGMEHGEGVQSAVARELMEEVGYADDFTYSIIELDEPIQLLSRDVWQMRVVLDVTPSSMNFSVGDDADEIQFINPAAFKDSKHEPEQKIYEYMKMRSRL